DSPKEKESQCFRIFRMICLFIIYALIIAYIIYYLLSFTGPSSLQMSRSAGDVPVSAVNFIPGSSQINNITCTIVNTTATSDCSNNITTNTDYSVYHNNILFSSSLTVEFQIYTVDSTNSKTASHIQDKLSSLLYENLYTLSPFQWNYILLERIQYQDLDTSLEKAMFTEVASKTSEHRVNYIGKVSSTTVVGFLSGLGGSTAFLLVIYKFCFGGYKPPGLLKPVLPEKWTV
ncbi:7787_t:CDS:2, partial [Dentiscutata erythropus]